MVVKKNEEYKKNIILNSNKVKNFRKIALKKKKNIV